MNGPRGNVLCDYLLKEYVKLCCIIYCIIYCGAMFLKIGVFLKIWTHVGDKNIFVYVYSIENFLEAGSWSVPDLNICL